MSSTAEMIEVMCPRCGNEFLDWHRPAQEPAISSTCPTCGYDPATDRLLHENGSWVLVGDDDEAFDR
jgi:endogenous inhibitor of DNA gyrase (YacG/DUF329 family)